MRLNKTLKNKKPTLVVGKIHANWCMHCVALVPEWKKMKTIVKKKAGNKFNVIFEEIEQSHEKHKVPRVNKTHLANSEKKLEVQGGYPTLFMIKGGKLEYYNGERYADPIAKWAVGGETEITPRSQNHTSNQYVIKNKTQNSFNGYANLGLFGGKRKTRKLSLTSKNHK